MVTRMTRNQLLEMWKAVRDIEDQAKLIPPIRPDGGTRVIIFTNCNIIKKAIQDELGQLE